MDRYNHVGDANSFGKKTNSEWEVQPQQLGADGVMAATTSNAGQGSISGAHDRLVALLASHGAKFASVTEEHQLIKSAVEALVGLRRTLDGESDHRAELSMILRKQGEEIAALNGRLELARLALRA
jgi:hypothetical protein